jgi:ABC-type multidrug transport system ATPase subunit
LFDLQIKNLTKRYGRLTALADVSFTLRSGEILGLIGPNGSGKTTLFESLSGVLPYDAGVITLNGRSLTVRERSELLFYVPDSIAPWPAQSVRWAINYTLGFFGGRVESRDEVVERLEIGPLLDSRIGALSKGQRKRVMLAVGLLAPQAILLADEPFEGLDLRQTREVAAALGAHAARGRTLFLSIHQISDAARMCDRFVLLSGGRICGEGTVDELASVAERRGQAAANRSLEEVFLALT